MCLNPVYLRNRFIDYGMLSEEEKKALQVRDFSSTDTRPAFPVPCGKCLECLRQQTTEWAFRCALEAKCHLENCIITLTFGNVDNRKGIIDYSNEALNKKDYQDFLKRLRSHVDKPIRYFLSAEYGSKKGRPHYHIIIFGWCPRDLVFSHYNEHKNPIFRSKEVEKIWGNGLCSVDVFNFENAFYCSKYLQKVVFHEGDQKNNQRPFVSMSLKPGIGFEWLQQNKDILLLTDKIYVDGHYIKTPRYFLKVLEREGYDLETIKRVRKLKASNLQPSAALLSYKRHKAENFLNLKFKS